MSLIEMVIKDEMVCRSAMLGSQTSVNTAILSSLVKISFMPSNQGPPEFPPIPQGNWDADVLGAITRIREFFDRGMLLLEREDINQIQYRIAIGHLGTVPNYRDGLIASGVAYEWVLSAMRACRAVGRALTAGADAAHDMYCACSQSSL